jgi:hypothetical protein
MPERVNCNADKVFSADLEVPVATTGNLGAPAFGAVTGVTMRISATKYGVAIHGDVNALAASERSAKAGRFYVEVDIVKMQTHVRPLGEGTPFHVIWSKSGGFDMEDFEYLVALGTPH